MLGEVQRGISRKCGEFNLISSFCAALFRPGFNYKRPITITVSIIVIVATTGQLQLQLCDSITIT